MNTNITFQYPAWFAILCLLLGIAYALMMYYRNRTFRERSTWLNWLLGIVRTLAVTFLSLLLLSPLLKSMVTETKKPIVVVAQDNSESIMSAMTSEDSTRYRQQLTDLEVRLGEEYDIKTYSFGDKVREGFEFTFKDKVSNTSELLNDLYETYSNQNLGAVVLATDGIYNQGSNPMYAGTKLSVPVYAVALGDTVAKRDISIKKIYHNRIAYLGDKFSIQVDVAARNCAGSRSKVKVYKVVDDGDNIKLKEESFKIKTNDFFTTKEIILSANSSGVQRYRVSVSSVKDEVTRRNNYKDIFIDVLDARQKILVLADAPHPDLSAIKQTVSKNKNYEVDIAYAGSLKERISGYDFVILHQLPSTRNRAADIIKELDSRKTPRLYVVGSQSNLTELSKVQSVFTGSGNTRNTNDVAGTVASDFNLFTLNENIANELPKFAPLVAPFGEFSASAESQVLLYQKIGSVETKYPLLTFGEERDIKIGVLAGEGIWKWRIFDYLQHQNHDIFDEVMSKTVQYLTVKEDKRKFRTSVSKNIFDENEAIYFDAELYNQSYELINEPDASLTITDSKGKDYNFTFSKTNRAYSLNAGYFPVGNYKYKARITTQGKELVSRGKFSVQPIELESYETTADHRLLRLLSEQYGGQVVYPDSLSALPRILNAKADIQPVLYSTSKTRSIINLKWIFWVLIGLLGIEWFFRKFYGGY